MALTFDPRVAGSRFVVGFWERKVGALKKEIEWAIKCINELEVEHSVSHLVFAFPHIRTEWGLEDPSAFVAAAVANARQQMEHPTQRSITVEIRGIQSLSMSLSSKERRILAAMKCLTLYGKRGKVFCAVPPQVIDSVSWGTTGIVGLPPYGSKWRLPVVLEIDKTCRALSERRSNEFKSDVNAAVAHRLSNSSLPIFRQLLQEMNRCWREPVCKCADRTASSRCEQCKRPYDRPVGTVAISLAAYEIGVRCAEQSLKGLLLLDDAELRQLPFDEQEERLKRWGHGLGRLWGRLNGHMRERIQDVVESADPTQSQIKVESMLRKFTSDNFNSMRYAWRVRLEGFAPNFKEESRDGLPLANSFAELEDLYHLFLIVSIVLRIISELLEKSPYREARLSVSSEPDYFQLEWEPPNLNMGNLLP